MREHRILLVEDDADSAEMLLTFLERAYEVRWVSRGNDAVESGSGFKPELVLLDLNLPDMDGEEIAARLKDTVSPPPQIVVLSASPDHTIEHAATTTGAVAAIRKPFSVRGLLKKIEQIFTARLRLPDVSPT